MRMGKVGSKLPVMASHGGRAVYRCEQCRLHSPAAEMYWMPQRRRWWCGYCARVGGLWDERGGSLRLAVRQTAILELGL